MCRRLQQPQARPGAGITRSALSITPLRLPVSTNSPIPPWAVISSTSPPSNPISSPLGDNLSFRMAHLPPRQVYRAHWKAASRRVHSQPYSLAPFTHQVNLGARTCGLGSTQRRGPVRRQGTIMRDGADRAVRLGGAGVDRILAAWPALPPGDSYTRVGIVTTTEGQAVQLSCRPSLHRRLRGNREPPLRRPGKTGEFDYPSSTVGSS